MDEKNLSLDEIREIFLYHYLNKQLIQESTHSKSVKEEYHRKLQNFSIGNNLFQKITDDQIIHDIPLSLETDFKKMCFITINLEPWNKLLEQLIRKVITLNIERAQADTFVSMTKYEREQPTYKDRKKETDDPELYAFIGRYLDIRKKQGRNLYFMTEELHQMKCKVIEEMMAMDKTAVKSKNIENILQIDFSRSKKKNEIASVYINNFCRKALKITRSGTRELLYNLDLFGFLYDAQKKEGQAPSILEFIENEINVCVKENKLLDDFDSAVQRKIDAITFDEIAICSTLPFYYIQNPLPLA